MARRYSTREFFRDVPNSGRPRQAAPAPSRQGSGDLATKIPERTNRLALTAPMGVKLGSEEGLDIPDLFVARPEAVERMTFADTQKARPLWVGPDTPSDRVAGLCKVFYATMKDSDFIEEARRMNIEVEATGGAEVQRIVGGILGAPARVLDRARKFSEAQ